VENQSLNEKERELMQRIAEQSVKAAEDVTVGIIDPHVTPNAFFNLLCYYIAYKTGTSLKHIMEMNLFDFVSYMYIVRETSPEESDNPNNPQEREMMRSMGG
jgi:hypothetical protein